MEEQKSQRQMIKMKSPKLHMMLNKNRKSSDASSKKNNFNISFNQDVFCKKSDMQKKSSQSVIKSSLKSKSSSSESLPIQRANNVEEDEKNQGLVNQRRKKKHILDDSPLMLEGVNDCSQRQNIINERFQSIKQKISDVNETVQICYFASRYGLKYKNVLEQNEKLKSSDPIENDSDDFKGFGALLRSQTPRNDPDQMDERNSLRQSKSMDFNVREERVRLSNQVKSILQSQLIFNQKYQFANQKEAYNTLLKTAKKQVRVEIGPKQMNNFDRQQINQFMLRIETQNSENQKRVMFVNQNIHQLLRGTAFPQVIQEEENEASQSINFQSLNMLMQVPKTNQSNKNFGNLSQYSSLIDGNNQPSPHQQKGVPQKRHTNTSSMLGGSIFNKSGLSQYDNQSNISRSRHDGASRRSSLGSNRLDQRPIFIICNSPDQGNQDFQNNFSQSQIEAIISQYKQMKNESPEKNGVDICNINIDENQQVKIIRSDYTFENNSEVEDLDENPWLKKTELDQVAEEDDSNERSIKSKKSQKSPRKIKNSRTGQFASGSNDSNQAPAKVIIENKDESPFQSTRKLQQKANEKMLENNINNFEKQSNKSMNTIKQFIDEEADKSDKQSKFSRRSLISNPVLQKIKEEEAGFSQSIAVKLHKSSEDGSNDTSQYGSELDNVFDQLMSGSQEISQKQSKQNRKNLQKKLNKINEKKMSMKKKQSHQEEEDQEFISKSYIRQQSQAHLQVKVIPQVVQHVVEQLNNDTYQKNSEDLYSHHYSSDYELPVLQKKMTLQIADITPVKLSKRSIGSPIVNSILGQTNTDMSSERLYDYNAREKKLLTRVIKLMTPQKFNKIWERIFVEGVQMQQQDIFKAIDRMAFERDPERQIRVKILDYNSLEMYIGPVTFTDGMSTIKFNGKRIVQNLPLSRRSSQLNISCTSFFKSQMRKFEQLNISNLQVHSIKTNTILGLIYGPQSVSFKQYLKNNFRDKKIMNQRCDQWRFISIMTQYQSYDLIIDKIEDAFDLIVSINEALIKQNEIEFRKQTEKINKLNPKQVAKKQQTNPNTSTSSKIQLTQQQCDEYKKKTIEQLKMELTVNNKIIKINTSKKILRFEMLRRKIVSIAEDLGYTLAQYFIVTIYNTICDQPEQTDEEVDIKLKKLKHILVIIKSHPKLVDVLEVLDYSTQQKLQRHKHKVALKKIMVMSEEERQIHLKAFFQKNELFGLKKPNDVTNSSINQTDRESQSNDMQLLELNPVSEILYKKSNTIIKDKPEDCSGFLAVIVEQNQSFEVSSASNCKEKLSHAGSSPKQVMRQINLKTDIKQHTFTHMSTLTKSSGMTPLLKSVTTPSSAGEFSVTSQKKLAKENWKKWLKQQSVVSETIEPNQQIKALSKKMRSLKFLERLKEKRKKREKIEKELEAFEKSSKRRNSTIHTFFSQNLLTMVKKREDSKKNIMSSSYKSSDPPGTSLSPDARAQAAQLKSVDCSEFNLHNVTKDQLYKKRREIIKWTKHLYCKENRLVQLDKYAKTQPIDENMLKALQEETDQQIIDNQAYIADEMKMINRSGKLDDFRALPVTSNFLISTGKIKDLPKKRNLDDLYSQGIQKLQDFQEYENSMSVSEYLAMRAKIAQAANIEWKYEYRRQQNLLKKLIEVSCMKADFDNLPEDDKRKYIITHALENEKSDAKNFKNLFENESDSSPRKINNSANRRLKQAQRRSQSKHKDDEKDLLNSSSDSSSSSSSSGSSSDSQ